MDVQKTKNHNFSDLKHISNYLSPCAHAINQRSN